MKPIAFLFDFCIEFEFKPENNEQTETQISTETKNLKKKKKNRKPSALFTAKIDQNNETVLLSIIMNALRLFLPAQKKIVLVFYVFVPIYS